MANQRHATALALQTLYNQALAQPTNGEQLTQKEYAQRFSKLQDETLSSNIQGLQNIINGLDKNHGALGLLGDMLGELEGQRDTYHKFNSGNGGTQKDIQQDLNRLSEAIPKQLEETKEWCNKNDLAQNMSQYSLVRKKQGYLFGEKIALNKLFELLAPPAPPPKAVFTRTAVT